MLNGNKTSPRTTRRRRSWALALAFAGLEGPAAVLAVPRSVNRPPLSEEAPTSVFNAIGRSGKFVPTKTFAYQAGPLPTNAWWENFATTPDPTTDAGNIFQMPYIIMTCPQAVHVIQPFMNPASSMDFEKTAGISLGIADGQEADGPFAADWDELSFTMGWRGGEKGWMMQVPLVRGSAYVTAEFNGVVPLVSSLQQLREHNGQHLISVDGRQYPCDGSTILIGRVFAIDVLEHDKTWLIFAPIHNGEGGKLEWICQGAPFSLTASQPLTGAVRVALANDCTTGAQPVHCVGAPHGKDASQYVSKLVEHAGSYPTSGKIDFSVDGDVGTMTWSWAVSYMAGFRPVEILQLAWPVHKPLLRSSSSEAEHEVLASTPFKDVRGPTVAVVGNVWDLHFDLLPEDAGFGAFRPLDESYRQEIVETIAGPRSGLWNDGLPDKDFDLPLSVQMGLGDTYFTGKVFGRFAQIIAIADAVGQTGEPWFLEMVDRLAMRVETWLGRDAPTPFLYDVSWGGLVSCGCEVEDCDGTCTPSCKVDHNSDPQSCPALTDEFGNFGNSVYNDHHFHYGYWVYAASVLAKFKPEWELQWREQILAIIRDYANPSELDHSFPVVRHKDWFLCFSWAGGIAAADERGRNQESTSEAVNAYYAIYTYGKAMEGKVPWATDLKDLGRIWTAMEAHGAETYWQIRQGGEVYNEADFPDHVIGILWSNSATHNTWFSKNDYAVSGIQLLPITPASETYLKADWVSQHFSEFQKDCQMEADCEKGWSWTVCLEQAIIDKQAALDCIHGLPENYFAAGDKASGGNSMANALYWIGTRDSMSNSAIKETLMADASELPALEAEADEGEYTNGGEGGTVNSGIAQGLAMHSMINRFSELAPVSSEASLEQGQTSRSALGLAAAAGLLAGAVITLFAYRVLVLKDSRSPPSTLYSSMASMVVRMDDERNSRDIRLSLAAGLEVMEEGDPIPM